MINISKVKDYAKVIFNDSAMYKQVQLSYIGIIRSKSRPAELLLCIIVDHITVGFPLVYLRRQTQSLTEVLYL